MMRKSWLESRPKKQARKPVTFGPCRHCGEERTAVHTCGMPSAALEAIRKVARPTADERRRFNTAYGTMKKKEQP
jgi:hypothetical protein